MSDTCSNCHYCSADYGLKTGHCHALPPPRYQNGQHYGTSSQPPQVQINMRACIYHKPLAAGESNIKGKSPETLNNALKHAHRELPTAVLDPIGMCKVIPNDKPLPAPVPPKARKPVNTF